MKKFSIAVIFYVASNCFAQKQNTTPVPILKQINRHNEDGSYSYGYEAGDGSFKIETKSATGQVKGKYGYIDADGNLREISYGADQHGFNPQGSDINVPPRTIHSESDNRYPSVKPGEIDDGQYREDPNIYLNSKYNSIPTVKASKAKPFAQNFPQNFIYQNTEAPVYEESQTQVPQFYQSRFNAPVQSQNYFQKPQQQNYYQQPNYYQPKNDYQQQTPSSVLPNIFEGHPAQNFDVFKGSYTVQY